MSDELEKIYTISEDIVAREIENEIVIVPIIAGIGSMDDDLYTLNSTGKDIWNLMNGKRSLADIAKTLEKEYDAPLEQICEEIKELVSILLDKRILIETRT